MRSPILVAPPSSKPVSLDEAKLHLRVDHDDDNTLIEAFIDAATSHLDGYTGILGRCLVEQTWSIDFDSFHECMVLPLAPLMEVASITWRNEAGQIATIDDDEYVVDTDAGGVPRIRFRNGYSFPSGLYESAAVSVTFKAGYAEVPPAIKVAILLMVSNWYQNREAAVPGTMAELPLGASMLLSPYKRYSI